jgi:hypothetical protein
MIYLLRPFCRQTFILVFLKILNRQVMSSSSSSSSFPFHAKYDSSNQRKHENDHTNQQNEPEAAVIAVGFLFCSITFPVLTLNICIVIALHPVALPASGFHILGAGVKIGGGDRAKIINAFF